MVDEPQTMKAAATMAMALARSARLHPFQSDFKSRIGYLSTSGEFVPEHTGVKSTAQLSPGWGTLFGSGGAQRPSENHHPSDKAIAFSFGVDSGSRNSPSDPA
jgi:hypothetical protein